MRVLSATAHHHVPRQKPTDATRTASASHQWFLTETAGLGRLRTQPSHLDLPNGCAPPPCAHQATAISNWLSANLRHSTVPPRVPFFHVSIWLPRERPPPPVLLGPDDKWPAWKCQCLAACAKQWRQLSLLAMTVMRWAHGQSGHEHGPHT